MKGYTFAGVGIAPFEVFAYSEESAWERAYHFIGALPSDHCLYLAWVV